MNPLPLARALGSGLASHSDADLLSRYVEGADADAFAELVDRYGPFVLAACRRVLRRSSDADDAFQAVFLVLARQARRIKDPAALPAWLHRVAVRTARRAAARSAASAVPDATADAADQGDLFAAVAWRDLRRVLDEELNRLPEYLRTVVVLCWLDGLTQDEAASRLGISLNTVKRRLATGRDRLRRRLDRRGLGPVLAAAAVLAPGGLRAAVPVALRTATLASLHRPASQFPVGRLAAGLGAALVTAAVAAGLAGALADPPLPPARPTGETPPEAAGPPLPPGVTARFGSPHFRAPDRIHASALSADGRLLALADGAGVQVYEAATWRPVHRLPADNGPGMWVQGGTLSFSTDGRFLGYTRNGEAAYVWDLTAGGPPRRFDGEAWRWTWFCAFTADGLFALSDKFRLYFYDPRTGKEVRSVPVPTRVIAASPDGRHFVRGRRADDPDRLVLGDAKGEAPDLEFEPLVRWTNGNTGVAFSPDGKTMTLLPATGKEVQVWDLGRRALARTLSIPEAGDTHLRGGPAAGFAGDGRMAWAKLPNFDIARWDVATGAALPTLKGTGGPRLMSIHAPPDGPLLTPTIDGWVRRWDPATGAELPVAGRYRYATIMALAPDGKAVAAADDSGRIDLLDPATGRRIRSLREQGDPVVRLAFNLNGTWLAVGERTPRAGGGPAERVCVVETAGGRAVRSFDPDTDADRSVGIQVLGFAGDAGQIVLADHPRQVRVADVRSGAEVRAFKGPRAGVLAPGGRWLATEAPGEVVLTDVLTGREAWRATLDAEEKWPPRRGGGYQFAWSADAGTLAVGLPGDGVIMLDPRTGLQRRRWGVTGFGFAIPADHPKEFRALAVSPDGARVLTAVGVGRTAVVWDAATGRAVRELSHDFMIGGAAFGPDGGWAMTYGPYGLGYRWDLTAGPTPSRK